MEDGTSASIRTLVNAVTDRPAEFPVAELINLAESAAHDMTVDLSSQPAMVYLLPRRHPVFAGLTAREKEVAAVVAAGYSNRQIATALFISVATVKDHVHAILTKTGFENRSQVAAAWLGATTRH